MPEPSNGSGKSQSPSIRGVGTDPRMAPAAGHRHDRSQSPSIRGVGTDGAVRRALGLAPPWRRRNPLPFGASVPTRQRSEGTPPLPCRNPLPFGASVPTSGPYRHRAPDHARRNPLPFGASVPTYLARSRRPSASSRRNPLPFGASVPTGDRSSSGSGSWGASQSPSIRGVGTDPQRNCSDSLGVPGRNPLPFGASVPTTRRRRSRPTTSRVAIPFHSGRRYRQGGRR